MCERADVPSNKPQTFSSFFDVDKGAIDGYGALDISLVNDLPLFIDPFLLFSSDDEGFQRIHREIVRYLLFLKRQAAKRTASPDGMLAAWFMFPEVKQTWLGFSETGNSGLGLGKDFALGLFNGLNTVFKDFGEEGMLESPHMEKFSLLRPNIGKDKISDFTTNFAKRFLLNYTEQFALEHIDPSKRQELNIGRVFFDYDTKRWLPEKHTLPVFNGDFVLLTPKSILTREETFINSTDMVGSALRFAPSIGNEALRFQFVEFITSVFADEKAKKKARDDAVQDFILKHPEIINYYIKYKEEHAEQAHAISDADVNAVKQFLIDASSSMSDVLASGTPFYSTGTSSFNEAKMRVLYLKDAIENQDVWRLLWHNGDTPSREADIQLLFRLVWKESVYDLNREPNNGRGPVDYTVSKGSADKAIVEFKLAKNTKLKQNLENQVDIYKAANKTDCAVTVIIFYTEQEQKKVETMLNGLGLQGNEQIVVIDARRDNKVSASNAK